LICFSDDESVISETTKSGWILIDLEAVAAAVYKDIRYDWKGKRLEAEKKHSR
jgi:hypothetical protein